MIITGGKDGKIIILSPELNKLLVIDISNCNSVKAEPRAIDLAQSGKNMIIGTIGSEIYEVGVDILKKKS